MNFGLETEYLEDLFPFFFALDTKLQIVRKGKSLEKISSDVKNFKEQFSYVRPSLGISYDFESILKFKEQVFIIKLLGHARTVNLKGQFILDKDSNLLYFWGTVLVRSEKDFDDLDLQIKDFSVFDWNISFLQVNNYLKNEYLDKEKLKIEFEKQKNFYELLFDYIPMDVAIFDSELRYTYINKSAIRNDELRNWLKGKTYKDYCIYKNLDLNLADEREANFRKILDEDITFYYEETYLKGSPEEKTIYRKMVPYISNDDKKYILAYGIDITKVKKANEEILEKNKELNKLNHELDGLVYSVTHDIRSPLHAVLGMIKLIENEDELNERSKEYISLIKASINRLDETINMIFDYSKNARTSVQKIEIDFDELIETIFKHFKREKYNFIRVIIHKNINAPFFSDPLRVRIILSSLISNALIFSMNMIDSFIEINIEVSKEMCEISVRDNGEGIHEKHHNLIFDMFYRASKKSVGSGLGLFICKESVEKLNGSINFTSIPEQGSNFIIKLPNDFCSHEKEIHFN